MLKKIFIIIAFCLILVTCQRNRIPTLYGNMQDPLIDQDGNIYQTVLIGNQVWMVENLKVTHYRNGDPILNVTDNSEWENLDTGAYCAYHNDESIANTYGYLYNWHAVDDVREISPDGWHVPSEKEWEILIQTLGGVYKAATKIRESGMEHWQKDIGATNESGFTALPAGIRRSGVYNHITECTYYWSSTMIGHLALSHGLDDRYYDLKIYGALIPLTYGSSVRLLKD